MKKCTAAAALLILLTLAAAVTLCEGGLRIPKDRRQPPDQRRAREIASRTHANWQNAEVQSTNGLHLKAWYFQPQDWHGDAVVLLHGVADSRGGVSSHAELLLKHGYAALLPDSRGHGESEGDLISYGVRESDDVHAWTQWLHDTARARRIYGLGESMGAAILLQAAVHNEFRAVVAESPFASFHSIAYDRVEGVLGIRSNPVRHLLPVIVEPAFVYGKLRYGIDLHLASPKNAVANFTTPVLLIHGTDDTNILPKHSTELSQARRDGVELWMIPGGRHVNAISIQPAEFERRVTNWFAIHL